MNLCGCLKAAGGTSTLFWELIAGHILPLKCLTALQAEASNASQQQDARKALQAQQEAANQLQQACADAAKRADAAEHQVCFRDGMGWNGGKEAAVSVSSAGQASVP